MGVTAESAFPLGGGHSTQTPFKLCFGFVSTATVLWEGKLNMPRQV